MKPFVPCPLCHAEKFTTVGTRGGLWNFRVINVICQGCGFVFRNPSWGPQEAAAYYRCSSRHYKEVFEVDRLGATADRQVERVARRVRWLQEYLAPGARVLDVGAGNGDFVAAVREAGFASEGIELDEEAVAHARARGLPMQLIGFEEGKWDPGAFAAITMFDVLEHSPDLRGFLRQARRLVPEEGMMFLEVPEAQTVHLKLEYYLLPEHNWHFTARTLRYALAQEGWVVRHEAILPASDQPADILAVAARKQGVANPEEYATGPEEHDRVLAHFMRARRQTRLPLSWALRDKLTWWLGPRLGITLYRPMIGTYVRVKKLLGLYRPPVGQ